MKDEARTAGPNAFERTLGVFSPRMAFRRYKARVAFDRYRRYEAAARGKRTAGWHTSSASSNVEIERDLPMLRNRARDLVRNNAWASKAVSVWTSNLIEKGIRPRAVALSSARRVKRKALDRADQLWREWGETTACDADGRHNFYGLERIVQREVCEAGEVLIRRRFRRTRDRLPVPLQLQVLEPDHLDTSRIERLTNGGRIIQGIEFNSIGRRVAYWLYPDHPGDLSFTTFNRFESVRIPASEILHVFRSDRAGQARGVPWGAPCMLTLRDFDDYLDAELVRVKIASSYVGFVKDIDGGDLDVAGDEDAADGDRDGALKFEPGTWEFLPEGKDIVFSKPPETDALPDYAKVTLRQCAAGFGVPYEALTGDLSGLSFSGGRLGRLDFRSSVEEWQQLGFIPQFCGPVWDWFVSAAMSFGDVISEPLGVEWTCPPARMIEPSREVAAQISAVKGGLMSLSEAIRRQGMNPDRVLEELARDAELAENLGLTLTTIGSPTPEAPPDEGGGTSTSSADRDQDGDQDDEDDQDDARKSPVAD